jgi:transcriptional regulator CtsR
LKGDEDLANRNATDLIESYLKKMIEDAGMVEIRRTEMADHFHVVPSQINYVINTRFTLPKGYHVVSKRGGGGYIRIVKVEVSDAHSLLVSMMKLVREGISDKDCETLIHKLYEEEVVTKREGNLMLTTLSQIKGDTAEDSVVADEIRKNVMLAFLERLDYEEA